MLIAQHDVVETEEKKKLLQFVNPLSCIRHDVVIVALGIRQNVTERSSRQTEHFAGVSASDDLSVARHADASAEHTRDALIEILLVQ